MTTSILADRLIDEGEAAAMLGVRRQTLAIWRLTARYGLRFVKVGRNVRYRLTDLDAFLVSRTVTSTAEADALDG